MLIGASRAFWTSFYAGVASGLIYSLIIGLLVGIALLVAESRRDNRRFRRECQREIAPFREQLRSKLNQPDLETFIVGARASMTAPRAVDVVALVDQQPLHLWWEVLPIERQFLKRVRDIQAAYVAFTIAASAADAELATAIRLYHGQTDTISSNDVPVHAVAVARAQGGIADQTILAAVDFPHTALTWINEAHAAVTHGATVASDLEKYVGARTELLRQLVSLRADLSEPEG